MSNTTKRIIVESLLGIFLFVIAYKQAGPLLIVACTMMAALMALGTYSFLQGFILPLPVDTFFEKVIVSLATLGFMIPGALAVVIASGGYITFLTGGECIFGLAVSGIFWLVYVAAALCYCVLAPSITWQPFIRIKQHIARMPYMDIFESGGTADGQ